MVPIRTLRSDEHPKLLTEIPDAPEKLYVRGTLPPIETKYLAVVGSRAVSPYGKEACGHLIKGLSGYPVSIVSGLALGVDGYAHRAALEAGLHTIAVPGSGLDDSVIYPRTHFTLAKGILEADGALLSEFEPLWKPRPESFPQRNRIMAGMSHATLIIEAGEKSGTLITARLAVDYNRDLLVVPHPIFADGGAGGHIFMKLGATPVRNVEDILDALGLEHTGARTDIALNENERKVIDALHSPIPRDELMRALGMKTAEGNVLLASMELRGIIAESGGEVRKLI